MTLTEAADLMRQAVNLSVAEQCDLMNRIADDLDVDFTRCEACKGRGQMYITGGGEPEDDPPCVVCRGTGWVSDGNREWAEALRLLAECGKCGDRRAGYHWMLDGVCWSSDGVMECGVEGVVSPDWWCEATGTTTNDVMPGRLGLLDAYAAADPATRERWAAETRALVPVKCQRCQDTGKTWVYAGNGEHEVGDCWDCTGRVPGSKCGRCMGVGRLEVNGSDHRCPDCKGTGRVPATSTNEVTT